MRVGKRLLALGLSVLGASAGLQAAVTAPAGAATEGDIVFVIDESSSMAGEQAAVKNNLTALSNQITGSGIDARYGLVGYGNGGAHGANSGHTHTDFTDVTTFQTALAGLVVTGGTEPAFDAIVHAGTLSYRANSAACVVLITDEPSSGDTNTGALALASLQADNATFFGIYDTTQSSSNTHFNPLATGTGGQNFSLASFTTSPAAVLTALGNACAAAITGAITLSPGSATNDVGTPHTVTANLIDANNNPIGGATVTFTVSGGPNTGATGTCSPASCTSNAAGQVSFTYTGTGGAGTDTIEACFTDAAGVERCNTAAKTWVVPIRISINDVTVTEGDSGNTPATFTLSLSAPAPPAGVTVRASIVNGTATAPTDFPTNSTSLLGFGPGATTTTFSVPVIGDLVNEPDETFTVVLSVPTNAAIGDGVGVGTILDNERDGAFACRASALRLVSIEPAVANAPNSPCADGNRSALSAALISGVIAVGSNTLNATTDQTPNLLEPTPPAATDSGVAVASVERATVGALSLIGIFTRDVVSRAEVRCVAGAGGQLSPVLTSSSTIAQLTLNGVPLNVNGSAIVNLPLGLGTIQVNRRVTTATSVTQQAIRIVLVGQEIVIAEARAGFSGNPCDE